MINDVRAEYLGHINDYKASGLSIKKYCAQHGLAAHKFIYYKNCERKKPKSSKSSSSFAEVVLDPPTKTKQSSEHGYYVDPLWLAQFVDKLLKSR